MSPARVGVNVHRHDVRAAIGIPGQHLEVGKVLRVVEGELGAQHLREIERLALVVAQVTAYQHLADDVLPDAGRSEVIALAGVELERDVRLVVRRVDDQLVANQARVEIAVGGRGALQVGLDALVGRVAQAIAIVQRQVVQDVLEQRVAFPRPVDVHVDVSDQHRLARVDVDGDAPVAVARLADARLDLRLVVPEGSERRLHLALHAVVQPLDRVGIEVRAALLVTL